MRPFTYLLACLFIISCAEDPILYNHTSDHKVSYNETDFNFILKAIHPPQEVDVVFGDGIRGRIPIRASVFLIFPDIKGEASLGKTPNDWHIKPKSARQECQGDGLRIIIDAQMRKHIRGSVWESKEVIISVESTDTNTDNPECIIWDIKDSDGSAVATFVAEGRIHIANSSCDTPR